MDGTLLSILENRVLQSELRLLPVPRAPLSSWSEPHVADFSIGQSSHSLVPSPSAVPPDAGWTPPGSVYVGRKVLEFDHNSRLSNEAGPCNEE